MKTPSLSGVPRSMFVLLFFLSSFCLLPSAFSQQTRQLVSWTNYTVTVAAGTNATPTTLYNAAPGYDYLRIQCLTTNSIAWWIAGVNGSGQILNPLGTYGDSKEFIGIALTTNLVGTSFGYTNLTSTASVLAGKLQ